MSVHPNRAAFAIRPAEHAGDDRTADHSLRLMAAFGVLAVVSGLVFFLPYLAAI